MKYTSLLTIMATAAAFLSGCSGVDTAPVEPAILSFEVVDQGNMVHVGKADEVFKTFTVNTVTSPSQVMGIRFRLTPNTSIVPDPSTLTENCGKNNKFILTSGDVTSEWHVLFPELDKGGQTWQLEWEDNFNGSWYNDEIWGMTPEGRPDWCVYMAPYKDLYEVKDGILTLWAKKNDNHPEDSRNCLTGGVWTRNFKSFRDGKLVIRACHDQAGGFWPSIWLRPQDGPEDEYSEIDIVELVKGKAHQTVHSDYTIAMNEQGTPVKDNTVVVSMEDFEGWHEYSVEIHEDRLVFGIDGKTTLTYLKRTDLEPGTPQQFPFYDRSFYLILSAQLGGKWAGNPVFQDLPSSIQIDYVKYYRLK